MVKAAQIYLKHLVKIVWMRGQQLYGCHERVVNNYTYTFWTLLNNVGKFWWLEMNYQAQNRSVYSHPKEIILTN